MNKKNRKKNNAQSMDEGIVGANESSLNANQSASKPEDDVVEGSETPLEANQTNPQMEPVDDEQGGVETDPTMEESKDHGTGESPVEDASAEDVSIDDLLADVRHTLIEEDEESKQEKKSSWWNRLVKGSTAQESPAVVPNEIEKTEIEATVLSTPSVMSEDKKLDEDVDEIDELIKLLETDAEEVQEKVSEPPAQQIPPPVEEETRIDLDELKRQAFTPRPEEEKPEEISDVRQVALAGEEDVFVEVESRAADPWDERVKSVENALRPYRTYLYYGLAFIGVVMAIMASVLVYNGIKQALPTPVPTAALDLPYPVTVSLPGGLNFNLGRGALKDGSWNPSGPEWLEGTEICRWVALPWSRQLEAAVRTMNREDVIELYMSNNDKISYQVESIQELTTAELQGMDSGSPCIAVILAKQDSEKRWVAVGRP